MAAQGAFLCVPACVLLLCLCAVLPAAVSQTNYYDTLNVETTATDSQIKRAFRKLAIKYHPDKNKSTDAEKTFREIAEAYAVLLNKEKRRLYDRVGHEAFLKTEASVEPDDDHETTFSFSFPDEFEDSPFMEDPYFQWSFHEEEQYERYSFEGQSFSLYYGDADENEEDHIYY
ncbi:dnaJ homolog subfamily B member 9-like [Parambassis ranga]|uniref:DnaJ homolog subfamily B member 9 n=1 Tax=Parambassis ranga TaxID=210632 RepID=A0A6P7I3M1_9TELE|nr:dnaJ homolog subfamily B member 9-like [Parambassis ranga]